MTILNAAVRESAQPIVAPSYWLFPEATTEASQIEAARPSYGLREDHV